MDHTLHILVTVPFKEHHMRRLREAAGRDAVVRQTNAAAGSDRMRELLREADVVIGEPAPALLAEGTPVRWVQMTWAGTDLYTRGDVPFPEGVRLTNVAGTAYGHIISQYVVGQVLAIAQNFPAYVRLQERRRWQGVGPVMSLEDAQVLILGAGDIGTCTARRLQGFGVRCVGVCRDTSVPRPHFHELVTLDEAEEYLASSHVVVNCLPNVDQTVRWLDERRLRAMRPGSILVNVGRGNFVDCDALARVLAEGHLRGAALDVTEPEPLPADHPLWGEPRCVITPHQAGGAFGKSEGTEEHICNVCCENLRRFVAGEPLTHVVHVR
ncbi:MAG: D-2-hydroxyacid dehydrogenase [Coriobacteriales bacterium]|nr:D-2-hydroxyacid dehydrogenase [Coriobacteriales bacterium]